MKQEVIEAFNSQIAKERDASVVYESLAIWCAANDYPGFAEFFEKQAKEESEHGEKLVKHLLNRGAKPLLGPLAAPPSEFDCLYDIAKSALDHEQANTKGVHETLEAASVASDYAAINFLNGLVNEQVEEEVWANRMVVLVKRATCAGSIYALDRHIVADLTKAS
jgi:ferritin